MAMADSFFVGDMICFEPYETSTLASSSYLPEDARSTTPMVQSDSSSKSDIAAPMQQGQRKHALSPSSLHPASGITVNPQGSREVELEDTLGRIHEDAYARGLVDRQPRFGSRVVDPSETVPPAPSPQRPATVEQPVVGVGRFPRPRSLSFWTFLEEQGVFNLYPHLAEALSRLNQVCNLDTLADWLRRYYDFLQQQQQQRSQASNSPPTAPTAPPSDHSSVTSVAWSLPSYACPGLARPRSPNRRPEPGRGRYACPMCAKRFVRKDDLRKHMEQKNPSVEFHCRRCQRRKPFHRLDKYRDHLKKKHPGEPTDTHSLQTAGVRLRQSHPDRCSHCSQPLGDFCEWLRHTISDHSYPHHDAARADPISPQPSETPLNTTTTTAATATTSTHQGLNPDILASAPQDTTLAHFAQQTDQWERLCASGEYVPRSEAHSVLEQVDQNFVQTAESPL
ncbi:hypothetical protein VTO42DRAFT_3823 [Malbranchea cinnamomea]